jgi:hypothetical protein
MLEVHAQDGRFRLASDALRLAGGGTWEATAAVAATVRLDGGALALEELRLASPALDGDGVRLGPVSLEASGRVAGGGFAGDVRLAATAHDLRGVAPELRALPASVRLEGRLAAESGRFVFHGAGCTALALAAGELAPGVRLRAPHALCLAPAGDAPLVDFDATAGGTAFVVRARLDPFALDLAGEDGPLVRGRTPRAVLRVEGGASATRVQLDGEGGSLHFPAAGLTAEGARIALELPALAPLRYAGTASFDALRLDGEPPPVAPLRAALRAEGDLRTLRFALTAQGGDAALALEAAGAHDLANGRGSARVSTAPLRFAPGGAQPAQLFPVVGSALGKASGELQARGALAWNARGLFPDVTLALRSLSAAASGVTVENLSGEVRILRFSPFVTTPAQELRFDRLAAGALLTGGLVRFGVSEGPRIEGFAASARFAGGAVALHGTLDLRAAQQELLLSLDGVEIAELLAIEPIEGLAASGRLRGRVPLVIAGDELRIEAARVTGAGGGVVQYRPARPLALLPGEAGRLVDRSLENFHYDVLTLDVAGSTRGRTHANLHLEGRNPDLGQLQPVHLNLALDTNYGEVLQQVLQLKRLGERLLSRRAPAAAAAQ